MLAVAGLDDQAEQAAVKRKRAAARDTERLEQTLRAHRECWEGTPVTDAARRAGVSAGQRW